MSANSHLSPPAPIPEQTGEQIRRCKKRQIEQEHEHEEGVKDEKRRPQAVHEQA